MDVQNEVALVRPRLLNAVLAVCSACFLAACGATVDGLEPQSGLAGSSTKIAANGSDGTAQSTTTGSVSVAGDAGGGDGADEARKSRSELKKVADAFAADPNVGINNYKIGPLDIIEISVFQVPDLSRSLQVAADGNMNYPLLGEVRVAGMTPDDLEQKLASELGAKYLKNPQVSVYVKTFNSQRFTIEGGIKKPGVYPLTGDTSLLQAMAVAGGLSELADESNIVVFRQIGTKRHAARFDVSAIRDGSVEDPLLRKGDVVVVHDSMLKKTWANFTKALPVAGLFTPLL